MFAVGDPDQSIYGFTGADPTYLRSLAEDPAVHQVQLNMNYRSAQQIIDGSQVALAPRSPGIIRSSRDDVVGELMFVECKEGLGEQSRVIATQLIPTLEGKGVPSGQIAILYIDRWDQLVLSKALDEAGIKYAGERDQRYPANAIYAMARRRGSMVRSVSRKLRNGPQFDDLFYRYAEIS